MNEFLIVLSKGGNRPEYNMFRSSVFSQQQSVSGKVTDTSGQPLPGVSIVVKGTTKGTITDSDGNFTLINLPADAVLVFSFVGMRTQEVVVGSQTNINVRMEEETIGIEEVVAVGYGTQKKVNLTGAVSNITAETLENRPITNIGQGLQGTMPGLNITQTTGQLGGGATFNIRGYTSITGGNPLILVDGIPQDPDRISPNDIAEVSILKDAASAAIYGARAAYGVILITTKKGKNAKPTISISSKYAVNKPTHVYRMMNGFDHVAYQNEGSMRVTGRPKFDQYAMAALEYMQKNPDYPGIYTHPDRSNRITPLSMANIDYVDVLLRDNYPMVQSNASVSGGTDRFDYYTSLTHLYQEGIPKIFNERYNQYDFLTRLNYIIFDWLKIGTRVSVNSSHKIFPPNNSSNQFPESYLTFQTTSRPWIPYILPNGAWRSSGSVPNVAQTHTDGGYRQRDLSDVWLTGLATLTPVKNLVINVDFSSQRYNRKFIDYRRLWPFYSYEIDQTDIITYEASDGTIIQIPGAGKENVISKITGYHPFTNPNSVEKQSVNNGYYVFNAYADYENTFANKHFFKALIGFNQENAHNTYFWAKRENLVLDNMPSLKLASGEQYTSDTESELAIRGAFSRLNYIFDDRYFIELNGRYDGTSKFSKADRFAFFPSVSLAWRLDNEKFTAGLGELFDILKIRASYGNLGNQNVSDYYPYISTFTTGQVDYLFGSTLPLGTYAPGLVSASLTWETVTQSNLGLDIVVFDSKLSGSIDIFRRDTKNMLTGSEPLPSLLAVSEPLSNAADLKTYGWDIQIDWKQRVREFLYGVRVTLSDYESEITRFENPRGLFTSNYVGKKIGEIWGLTTDGMFQTDEEAQAADHKNLTARQLDAGDLRFKDLDGDGKITKGEQTLDNPGDMSIIGNSTPRYSFGLKTNLSWKGWNLDLFFQGILKRDVWLSTALFLQQYTSEWTVYPAIATDWWSEDNRDALFPRPRIGGATDVTQVQTHWLQNGAYIRLKQLTLRYTVPQLISRKISMDRLSVYLAGNNLWEYTQMIEIVDPEMTGAQYYPVYRSLSVGLNIDF